MNRIVSNRSLNPPTYLASEIRRYARALAVVAIAIVLRFLLEPYFEHAGFAIFLGAVLLAAWVGGVVPSLIAVTLLLLAVVYWFSPSTERPWDLSVGAIVGIAAYYLVGTTVAVLSDLTTAAKRRADAEKNEALSQREQLRATLACIGDAVIVTDAESHITLMNTRAEGMTGWTVAEATGRPLNEVFRLQDEQTQLPLGEPARSTFREGQILHQTAPVSLTTRDQRNIPIAYTAAPIRAARQEMTGVVLVFRDESERLDTEEVLRSADRRKDEFLATLAHELRNPLAPICMGLELLKVSKCEPESIEEVRSMMERQAQHMVRLIDDLLDVSRITRGKVELRPRQVELADVVQNAVDSTRPFLEESGHQLKLDLPTEPVYLNADFNRLTQVFSNLLNNAAKYTPSGGQIELSAKLEPDAVTLSVSDTGIGIPPDMQDAIFELFTQVNGTTNQGQTGLGIGLTLVKRLTEMHGGAVTVESKGSGQGSTFRIKLPIVHPPPTPEIKPVQIATRPPGRRRRVLIVDDNEDALNSLSKMIELLGHPIRKAHDGLEAIENAKEFQPELVLLDLGMPKLDGYEAARRIRQGPGGAKMILVATTGWGQAEDRQRTTEAGFDHHLVKPIDLPALQALLSGRRPRSVPASAGESWTL